MFTLLKPSCIEMSPMYINANSVPMYRAYNQRQSTDEKQWWYNQHYLVPCKWKHSIVKTKLNFKALHDLMYLLCTRYISVIWCDCYLMYLLCTCYAAVVWSECYLLKRTLSNCFHAKLAYCHLIYTLLYNELLWLKSCACLATISFPKRCILTAK